MADLKNNQTSSSTPGEVERLIRQHVFRDLTSPESISAGISAAVAAILSHISTAARAVELAAADQTARLVAESNALERQERALVAAERAYREAFDRYGYPHLTALRHRVALRAALSAAANPQDQE